TVDVTINGDTTHEADETFTVDLSNPGNAGIADGSGIGTITNDDQVPDVSIDDQSITEGNAGTSTMTFNVTLSNPSDQTITVDYAAGASTLTFGAGETSKTIDVTVHGDATYEADEHLTVDLSNASGATIADDSGTGTITNDDAAPTFAIDDVSLAEGNTGLTS